MWVITGKVADRRSLSQWWIRTLRTKSEFILCIFCRSMKSCIVTLGGVVHASSWHLRGGGRRIEEFKVNRGCWAEAQRRRQCRLTSSDGHRRAFHRRLLEHVGKRRSQHHGESGLYSRPSSPYLENVKLKLWEAEILQQKILANQVIRGSKTSLGNAILYFAWAGGQTGALSVTIACVWEYSHACSWRSFNNSKYFKTAVKSTVTFSPKIVSCEKNIF